MIKFLITREKKIIMLIKTFLLVRKSMEFTNNSVLKNGSFIILFQFWLNISNKIGEKNGIR